MCTASWQLGWHRPVAVLHLEWLVNAQVQNWWLAESLVLPKGPLIPPRQACMALTEYCAESLRVAEQRVTCVGLKPHAREHDTGFVVLERSPQYADQPAAHALVAQRRQRHATALRRWRHACRPAQQQCPQRPPQRSLQCSGAARRTGTGADGTGAVLGRLRLQIKQKQRVKERLCMICGWLQPGLGGGQELAQVVQ